MITFDNTIATSKTYLNLKNVSKILFCEPCLVEKGEQVGSEWWDDCHIVYFNDNRINIISAHTFEYESPETEKLLNQKYLYIKFQDEYHLVIRDKELYQAISELMRF